MDLASKLTEIREGAEKNIPPATLEVMHRATRELEASGLLDQLVSPGKPLPAFEMANQFGETISSQELLADGPLVLTVYRGLW